MRTFRSTEEFGKRILSRDPDYKAILLIAAVDAALFLIYHVIPFAFRAGAIGVFTLVCVCVLWPRIVGEQIVLTSRGLTYRRGLGPFVFSNELEWRCVDSPRILNPGVRGWRGPIGFNDTRTGKPYRVGAGLTAPEGRKVLEAVEQFRARTFR